MFLTLLSKICEKLYSLDKIHRTYVNNSVHIPEMTMLIKLPNTKVQS